MLNRSSKLVVFFLAAACTRASTVPGSSVEIADPMTSAPASTGSPRQSWSIIAGTLPLEYSSTVTTTLELLSDSAAIHESVLQRSRFTLLTASASGSTSFLGSIHDLSTEAGNRIGQPDVRLSFPITFTGHVLNGVIVLDALNGQARKSREDCSDPALSALSLIHRNIIILPSRLIPGMTWSDSTSAAVCSGTVPITTTSIRTYRVAGESNHEGRPALLIERNEKILSTGEGSQNQHRISIKTEGKGFSKFYIDRVTGALLDSNGEQQTEITINASRLQRFKQTVRERTTVQKVR